MSRFKLLIFFAVAALVAVPAFAEVQNIKISGELAFRQFFRSGMGVGTAGGQRGSEEFQMATATVDVDADLTDNVSACVGLAAETLWGQGLGIQSPDVGIYKAYITLKEFFYTPLTLNIGRQPLWFGKGFIVGNNVVNWDPQLNLSQLFSGGAREYSKYTNFDAVRLTLDYNPWTIDSFYSKISEGLTNISDDTRLWGVNIGYKFSEYNAEAEAYYFGAADSNSIAGFQTDALEPLQVHTFGLRGSFDPLANISLWGEAAYQFGKIQNIAAWTATRTINAWACDVGGEYRFSDYAWKPKLGGEFILYSGEANSASTTGKWYGWINYTRGKHDSVIREFHNVAYRTLDAYDIGGGISNQMQFAAFGGIRPIYPMSINARYTHFRKAKKLSPSFTVDGTGANRTRSKHIGDEIDVLVTFYYTEDVVFNLLGGLFIPGDYFKDASGMTGDPKQNSTEHDIVSTVKIFF